MERYFPAIYKNSSLCDRLGAEIKERRFPHAYIISGKKGSGKHTLAINIAAALACSGKENLPCGICDNCHKILNGFSPDVIYIHKEPDKKEFTVNLIRQIKESIFISPNELEKRVYIIEDAETMNQNAQNAFLKILEEPPSYVVFLLLCSDTQKLLDTIKSRASTILMEYISADDITNYLIEHSSAARDLNNTSPEKIQSIALSADGSIGAALELCENGKKQEESRLCVTRFLDALTSVNLFELDLFCDELPSNSDDFTLFLEKLKIALRDICAIKYYPKADLLFFTDSDCAESYAFKIASNKVLKLLSEIDAYIENIKFYLDLRLAGVNFCGVARRIMIE